MKRVSILLSLCSILGCATGDKCLVPDSVDRVPKPEDVVLTPGNHPNEAHPVLVFLHGRASSAKECAQALRGLADSLQCVVFVPCAPTKLGVRREDNKPAYEWNTSAPGNVADRIEGFLRTSPQLDGQDVYLGGISMGGNMALLIGLERPQLFGGIVSCSGYLNPWQRWSASGKKLAEARCRLPILVIHGIEDPNVPCEEGRKVAAFFTKQGFATRLETFNGGHVLPPDFAGKLKSAFAWFADTRAELDKPKDQRAQPTSAGDVATRAAPEK